MIHANSISSYKKMKGARIDRLGMVLDCFAQSRQPLTDRQVMERLGFFDKNAVSPRITELIKIGKVVDLGNVQDPTTNRSVRVCTNRVMA